MRHSLGGAGSSKRAESEMSEEPEVRYSIASAFPFSRFFPGYPDQR
jgi:hypothetical protein